MVTVSGVGTMGTGGYIVPPNFRTCTPCTPQVKDAAYDIVRFMMAIDCSRPSWSQYDIVSFMNAIDCSTMCTADCLHNLQYSAYLSVMECRYTAMCFHVRDLTAKICVMI